MNKFSIALFSLLIFIISSCQKDANTSALIENLDELVVPSQFDWATSRDVNFSISITDARFGDKIHIISIYAGDPGNGGHILSKGSATLTTAFNTKVYLPSADNEVYVVKTSPDGTEVTHKVSITTNNISLAIGVTNAVKSMNISANQKSNTSALAEVSPGCPNVNGNKLVTSSKTIEPRNGDTYSVTGSNITVTFGWANSGTVYICGKNVVLKGGNMNGLTIIVTSSGSVTIDSDLQWNGQATLKNFGILAFNSSSVYGNMQPRGTLYNAGALTSNYLSFIEGSFTNFGTVTINEAFLNEGIFTNEGVFNSKGTFTTQNNGQFINKGSLNADNNFILGSGTVFNNYGTSVLSKGDIIANSAGSIVNSGSFTAVNSHFEFAGALTNDGTIRVKSLTALSGSFLNRCKLLVEGNFFLNGATMNNLSFIEVKSSTAMNSDMQLSGNAIFVTKDLTALTGLIKGTSTGSQFALFRVSGVSSSAVNSAGGVFDGKVLYCDALRTLDARHFSGAAKSSCSVYIEANACNEGYGTAPNPTLPDTDGDGVIDIKDDFPNDPTKAYKHFQSNFANGGSTIAFEDTWPSKGDYDMNDVVINYRYQLASNAANQIVEIKADYTLLATGGQYKNGAGISFNIPKANAESITGATIEDGQDSIVVVLFTDSRAEQLDWNTKPTTIAASKSYSVTLKLKNGPSVSELGIGNYNFFIWNNGFGRGFETHLPGKRPTKLANTTLFGTKDDGSTDVRTYFTNTGLPWALDVPVSNFSYPQENVDITKAYLKFASWAQSNKTLYTDWYSNAGSGYRNDASLFVK